MSTQPMLPFGYLPTQWSSPAARKNIVAFNVLTQLVCDEFGIKPEILKSGNRARAIARPRQVLMYLAREDTARSLPWIGAHIGSRDHTTVLHGWKKITDLLGDEKDGPRLLEAISKIRSNYPPHSGPS
ncbi:MAG: Chromosomal replication initiator protein DnaA [Parcubacteria bacterium C7867-004]|nr:MAG: Chromosomal replication initiator protein DnaA [Parcubacteria bacterium C7867-004]